MAVRFMGQLWGKAAPGQKEAHMAMKTRQGKNYDNYRDPSKPNAERDNYRGLMSMIGFKSWANKKENEDMLWYNSPRHQMQLLREAGLNPALMMNGNPFQPDAGFSYDGPDNPSEALKQGLDNASSTMSMYQSAAKFDPQMDLLNSQVNEQNLKNDILSTQAQYAKQEKVTNLAAIRAQMAQTQSGTELNRLKQDYQRELNRDPLRVTKYQNAHKYEGIVTHMIGKVQKRLADLYNTRSFATNDFRTEGRYAPTMEHFKANHHDADVWDKKYWNQFKSKRAQHYPWNKYKTNR